MEITLREDLDPDIDFYYHHQFKIYHDSYLIWDRDTWEAVLRTCTVYRIEGDGQYAGDVILEDRGKRTKSIIDFSILPEYQGRGVGRAALEKVKEMGGTLTAVTRKETFDFFLKCGFVLKKLIKNYYHRGVDGYYIVAMGNEQIIGKREVRSV
ncbi:MAG: GNAT family N-acetyltransferase [Thermodesulfobacteriota bacterium]